jgi:CheY-like chemotaxis protein
MNDDLLSLRALVVSPEEGLRDLFRQAAAACPVPTEIVEVSDAAAPNLALVGASDLAYVDGALPPERMLQVVSALRASAEPPFTVQLATSSAAQPFECDGLAGKPARPEQARWLLERSLRVRLTSRVLVVDDSSTMRSIVRKALAGTRFPLEISEADEGFAALKLVRESDFHIVFLDYNMPDLSGLETLAEFKRDKRRISVVLMTSAQDNVLANRARVEGAGFLRKPFFPADIEAVLCGFYGLRALNPKRA